MKQVTDNAERAKIVENALAAIKLLSDMEKADLKAQEATSQSANTGSAKPSGSGKKTTSRKSSTVAQDSGNTALLARIDEYLSTPEGKAAANKSPSKPDDKGFRPRNGRMDIIRAVVKAMGVETATQELLDKVNEVSTQRGLKAINKTAFYTLVSEVRKEMV